MKTSKIIWLGIGGAALIAVSTIAFKKISKSIIESRYGKGGGDSAKPQMTAEQAQKNAEIIKSALTGWTSTADEDDIFNALGQAKTKADLELIMAKFNEESNEKLIPWLKSDVDRDRAKRLFDRLGVVF